MTEVIITSSAYVRANALLIKPVGIRGDTKQFAQLSQLFWWIINDIIASLSVVVI